MGILEELGLDCSSSKTVTEMKNELFEIRKRTIHRQNAPNIEKRLRAELLLVNIGDMSSILENITDDSIDASLLLYTYGYAYDNKQLDKDALNDLILAGNKNLAIVKKIMNLVKKNSVLFNRWSAFYTTIGGRTVSNSNRKPKYIVVRSGNEKQTINRPEKKTVVHSFDHDKYNERRIKNEMARENAIEVTRQFLAANAKAQGARIKPSEDGFGGIIVGGKSCPRYFFHISCDGILLGDDKIKNFSDVNPLEAEVIFDSENPARIRRIDLYFDGIRVYSVADYDGLEDKAIQQIKFFANFDLSKNAGMALNSNDYAKALSCYNGIMLDDPDAWAPKFFIPCLKAITNNDFRAIEEHLGECRKTVIKAYDEISGWTDKKVKTEQVSRVCRYSLLAVQSSFICVERKHIYARHRPCDINEKSGEYARAAYACALLAVFIGNQLEARFLDEIPVVKQSMLRAWSDSLPIFEFAIKYSWSVDMAKMIKLYEATKKKYELYGSLSNRSAVNN